MKPKIKLDIWAAAHYDPAPSLWTLRKWARDGELGTSAERVGRDWYVDPDAVRVKAGNDEPRPSLVTRLATPRRAVR